MRRRSLVAFTAAVACVLAVPPSSAVAGPPVGLELDPGQQSPTLDLGDTRDNSTLVVRFLAAKELTGPPSASLLPFQTSDGVVLDAKVKPSVKLHQEGRTVAARIDFSELEQANSGTYTSSLLLRGKGVADARATVTIKLEPTPVFGADLWAVLLLFAGAVVGLIGRWVVTAAAKVHAQADRLAVVEAKIKGVEPLPAAFTGKLTALRIQLAQENTEASEETLKEVENQAVAAIQVAEVVNSMRASIAGHEKQIGEMQSLGEALGKLQQVLVSERELTDRALSAPKFETDEEAQVRAGYLDDMRRVRVFLTSYATEAQRPQLAAALEHFMKGEFEEGDKEAGQATGAAQPLTASMALTPTRPMKSSPVHPESDKLSLRGWAMENAPTIAAGFTAVALVIVGLFTAYHPDSTFRTDAFMDAVALFAWGLGSAAAGIGLAELTGKLTAGKSTGA